MGKLTGEERWGWIPEVLECSGKHFGLLSRGAGEPLRVFERGEGAHSELPWKC